MLVTLTRNYANKKAGDALDLPPADAHFLLTEKVAALAPDPTTQPPPSLGRFLLAAHRHDHKALIDMGSCWVDGETGHKAALNEQSGPRGGYLVPTPLHNQIMGLAYRLGVVRPHATVLPMSSADLEVPAIDATLPATAGRSPLLSAVAVDWREESSALAEKPAAFKQVLLHAHELGGYTSLSNSLLRDAQAAGLEAAALALFARAIAWHEDYAFLRGTGAGQPLGLLTWAGLISVTRSGANTIALADVAGMYARLIPGGPADSIIWACHPTALVPLLSMSGGAAVLAPHPTRPGFTLLGHDIRVTDALPPLGTPGDLMLLDLSAYLIGDRQQIDIAASEHPSFLSNQTLWRFTSRLTGQPWPRDKLTLADGSTVSTAIALSA